MSNEDHDVSPHFSALKEELYVSLEHSFPNTQDLKKKKEKKMTTPKGDFSHDSNPLGHCEEDQTVIFSYYLMNNMYLRKNKYHSCILSNK